MPLQRTFADNQRTCLGRADDAALRQSLMLGEPHLRDPVDRGLALVRLFCAPEAFGRLRGVRPDEVPQPARHLLDHRSHMTVTMERFHGTEVRLRIVDQAIDQATTADGAAWYAREILLESPAGRVLQHGIVRIDLSSVAGTTAREIRDGRRPLGRVLIDAGVLRDVHGVSLLEIIPGPHLAGLLGTPLASPTPVYGRVADILLNGKPAVELLEIVAPTE